MRYKSLFTRKTILMAIVISAIMCFSLPMIAGAETEVRFTTNGAAANYAPGSVMIVYGRVENNGIGVPHASTLVEAAVNGNKFYFSQSVTNKNGYFRAGFNVPISANAGDSLSITVNNSKVLQYTLKSQETINNSASNEPFELLGFTTPGYLKGETVRRISADTTELGIVFSKNVNYFNNKNAGDLKDIGENIKNADCFTLYQGKQKVAIRVDLLDSEASGGNEPVVYTTISGDLAENTAKDTVLITVPQGLQAETEYRLLISGELASNSSITLGEDKEIYFMTSSTGSGGSRSRVDVQPSISGNIANIVLSNEQMNTVVDGLSENQKIAEIVASNTDQANEVSFQFTAEQSKKLAASVEKIAFNTPLGEVVLPREILGQITDLATLSISKDADKADTFSVTLKDGSKLISSLSGRVRLELPVSITGSVSHVLTHNGTIMKNSLVENGIAYGTTSDFSIFAVSIHSVNFSDIDKHWGQDNIEFLAARNIVNGIADDIFAPDKPVSRAEFVKILVNSMDGLDMNPGQDSQFNDVKAGQWYSDYINWAAQNRIVNGYGDGSFGINRTISRQEMAVVIQRFSALMGIELKAINASVVFVDNDSIAPYARDAVQEMQQAGIINGKNNNSFEPNSNASRAEAAKMINKMIEIMLKSR